VARRLILDAGAVLAFTRGDRTVGALLKAAHEGQSEVAIPPVVVTQTMRGGSRDAAVHRLVHAAHVPFVGFRLARSGGELLGASGLVDAADAQVMAEALRSGPAAVATSDPTDMAALAGERAGRAVVIVPV
jgi:predicted nucleic acid-binding protein